MYRLFVPVEQLRYHCSAELNTIDDTMAFCRIPFPIEMLREQLNSRLTSSMSSQLRFSRRTGPLFDERRQNGVRFMLKMPTRSRRR